MWNLYILFYFILISIGRREPERVDKIRYDALVAVGGGDRVRRTVYVIP